MNGKNTTLLVICTFVFIFASYNAAITKKLGSPAARTGSPGDGPGNTCAMSGCHVGGINTFPGSVAIDVSDIPSNGYVSGQSYTIGVTVAESGRSSYGFQLTAEDGAGNKMGNYLAASGSKVVSGNWVTHTSPNSSGSWTFDWIAPSGNSTVTFYAIGNAANGNNSASGDHIYASNVSVQKDIFSSVADVVALSGIRVWTSYGSGKLFVETDDNVVLLIYSITGEFITRYDAGRGRSDIDISGLRGAYLITEGISGVAARFIDGY